MPYKYFQCPDKQVVEIESCLKNCRMGSRCLSIPTLRLIAEQRPWTGKPSTTQLLKGTREAYLQIVKDDLVMAPKDQLFRILGTKSHAILEGYTENELSEERLSSDVATGAFDLYDPESKTLYDYKTWGSYKVAMALGIEMVDVETGGVYKTGAKKGQPKTRKEPRLTGKVDNKEVELQLNHYRIMLEDAGFPVEQILVEAIVRDGNTIAATSKGITENGYLIPVRRLDDDEVIFYFTMKAENLKHALETGETEKCTSEERWNDRKCQKYCDVAKHCEHGRQFLEV